MGEDILVVEDDDRIAELLAWFLERRGFAVRLATTFERVWEALGERRADLVLCDVQLADSSARDVLPRLSAEGLLPPTVIVSGFLDSGLEQELLAVAGVVAVVHKPYELAALEAVIREQLRIVR